MREAPIPYINSVNQIPALALHGNRGRDVVNPGVAEVGPHPKDQVPHARARTHKPMEW